MPASDSLIVSTLRAAGCVFAEDEARLLMSAARTLAELDAMVGQRVDGLPLEHVLGWAEFCGLRITVAPSVFVPRRRTEFLVRQATVLAGGDDPPQTPPPRSRGGCPPPRTPPAPRERGGFPAPPYPPGLPGPPGKAAPGRGR